MASSSGKSKDGDKREEFLQLLKQTIDKLQDDTESATSESPMEPPEIDFNNDRYDFESRNRKRGLALIINNEYYRRGERREGSAKDAKSLKERLLDLGFDVLTLHDLTAKEMRWASEGASRFYNHQGSDCFVYVVLSHGGETEVVKDDLNVIETNDAVFGVDGKPVCVKDIVEWFSDENTKNQLANKPRLFFIEACRGEKDDPGVSAALKRMSSDIPADDEKEDENEDGEIFDKLKKKWKKVMRNYDKVHSNPLYKDCLIMYATPPGFSAWRRTVTGSYFICELCSLLKHEVIGRLSFLKVLSNVSRRVALKYESSDGFKEMPMIDTMLIKDIYMTKKTSNHEPKAQRIFFGKFS